MISRIFTHFFVLLSIPPSHSHALVESPGVTATFPSIEVNLKQTLCPLFIVRALQHKGLKEHGEMFRNELNLCIPNQPL